MSVLVLGGAGYIGSVVVEHLVHAGRKVVVIDSLSTGHAAAVEPPALLVQGDIGNMELIEGVIREHKVESIMHFCAWSLVEQSVREPLRYYENNIRNGINLLCAMARCGVRQFIFSSSAAVFGEPESIPIGEEAPLKPKNPYGRTKAMFEEILRDCAAASDLRYMALRYFNACGATEKHGEDHHPESHLIPVVLDVATGKREALSVFGKDYPTPDGTCVRDYIHVSDLAEAHIRALSALEKSAPSACYNLGNGHGFSVLEVAQAAEEVSARKIPIRFAPRRAGDPAALVASSEKIREDLRWFPQMPDLRRIIETAWEWRQKHPHGYGQPPEPRQGVGE